MAIQLIIKGNIAQAHDYAREYGISLNQVREHPRFDETIARCSDDYRTAVVRWFCTPHFAAPYPIGTLLWYGENQS